jgi:hypothetical protein
MAEPGIEVPMIKEYNSIPDGMSKSQYESIQWFQEIKVKEPFPLKEIIYKGLINIDKAFKVNKVIFTPKEIPCFNGIYKQKRECLPSNSNLKN